MTLTQRFLITINVDDPYLSQSIHSFKTDQTCSNNQINPQKNSNNNKKSTTTTTTTSMNTTTSVSVFIILILILCSITHQSTTTTFSKKRSVQAPNCGTFECTYTEYCCHNNYIGPYLYRCYDPHTHSCAYDDTNPLINCLCGRRDGCCNKVCYDSTLYECNKVTKKIQLKSQPPPVTCGPFRCPPGNNCCSNNIIGIYPQQCYSPSTHVCIADSYNPSKNCLCGRNDRCCKGVCYDANIYNCVNGAIRHK